MANQYTRIEYTKEEIKKIISYYKDDNMTIPKISKALNRQKNNIKQILIDEGVWVENRDKIKKEFSNKEINEINTLYQNNLSIKKIADKLKLSTTPIKRILKESNSLRGGYSDGKKINLTDEQKKEIKMLYLNYTTPKEISKIFGVSSQFIEKHISDVGYRRSQSETNSMINIKRYHGIDYEDYKEFISDTSEYKNYVREVYKVTRKQPIETLLNHTKRGSFSYHLDHKYSINEGFKNKIDPNIIGSIHNLEFIKWDENITKRTNCSITITELKKLI